jgi:hypothetical protein
MENKKARTATEIPADKTHNPPPGSENPITEAIAHGAPGVFIDSPPDPESIEIPGGCTACGGGLRWIPRISRFALLSHYRCTNCGAVMVAEEITDPDHNRNSANGFEIRPCECTREHVDPPDASK